MVFSDKYQTFKIKSVYISTNIKLIVILSAVIITFCENVFEEAETWIKENFSHGGISYSKFQVSDFAFTKLINTPFTFMPHP
jgi:hypothetical protein